MTILLTGGTGFLGSHIAEQLSREGREVRALVRKTSDTSFLRTLDHVELVEGSVDDAASLPPALQGVHAVVHCAGLVKARTPDEFHRTNAEGTRNLLDAATRVSSSLRRVVYVSTQAVSGPSEDGAPLPLDAPPNPLTHYARSKLAAEQEVLARRDELPVTVLRPPAIYGPRDREILAIFKAVNVGLMAVMGSPDRRISMVFGPDAAQACLRAIDADTPSGAVYYIEDGTPHRFGDMITAVERALGKRAWLRLPLPRPLVEAAALATEAYGRATRTAVMLTRDKVNELFAPHWVCDGSAARAALAWQPTMSFEEGVRVTAQWYRQQGWL